MSDHWTNADGLQVPFGQDQARETKSIPGKALRGGSKSYLVMDFDWDSFPDYTADLNNDGTNNGFSDSDAYIPAGSYITNAWLIVTEGFASGTDYDIGTYQQDGSAISSQGIDATLQTADINVAEDVVVCDGTLVDGILSVTLDSYIKALETGTFDAGEAKLVIEYMQVAP